MQIALIKIKMIFCPLTLDIIMKLQPGLTILSGRPSSGKTRLAMRCAEHLLRQRKNVIYFHAEGPEQIEETEFEFSGPGDLQYFQYIPDLFTTPNDLFLKLKSHSNIKSEVILIIDTIELLEGDSIETVNLLGKAARATPNKILVLSQLPRVFESRPIECAEEFMRRKFDLKPEDTVIVLGKFPDEI
jgi:KaiC/GvpD/RAD55 family RecA-like ATPase